MVQWAVPDDERDEVQVELERAYRDRDKFAQALRRRLSPEWRAKVEQQAEANDRHIERLKGLAP